MRILLAEDQIEIRLLTADRLKRSGHYVVAVANGQEAVDAFEREPFDAVLMDEQMPVMDGLEALRAVRQREKERGRVLLIALTGYNTEPDRVRLLRAGFDSVLGKPFRLAALDALFQESPDAAAAKQGKVTPPEAPKTPAVALLERVGGDEPLARKIITTFLRNTPGRMAEMHKTLQQKDGPGLASLAHALKGSVSIFGAEQARGHCQELQELARSGEFPGLARVYEQLKEEIAELEQNLRGYAGQKNSPGQGANLKAKRRNSSPKRKAP